MVGEEFNQGFLIVFILAGIMGIILAIFAIKSNKK